jgi:hypothetical protein
VGGKSFKSKTKQNWVGGGEKIKFPKKKPEIKGRKKLGRERGKNKVAKKN